MSRCSGDSEKPFSVLPLKEHIQEIFSTYGKIKMIDMPMNRVHPHLSKGYAYVEFETPEEAEKALKHMDGGKRMRGQHKHGRLNVNRFA